MAEQIDHNAGRHSLDPDNVLYTLSGMRQRDQFEKTFGVMNPIELAQYIEIGQSYVSYSIFVSLSTLALEQSAAANELNEEAISRQYGALAEMSEVFGFYAKMRARGDGEGDGFRAPSDETWIIYRELLADNTDRHQVVGRNVVASMIAEHHADMKAEQNQQLLGPHGRY